MLERKMLSALKDWRDNKKKDCLLIKGMRQCGKTYIVRKFGESYENFIEINFILRPEFINAFGESLDVRALIQSINLYEPSFKFIPGKTLVFLDEIQNCPNARTSLKSWAEDERFDVIASGSLLGIHLKNETSIPVGYETQIEMFPLDFEEFLWAKGISKDTINGLKDYLAGEKQPEVLRERFVKFSREYMVVGGMPEVVNSFVEEGDYRLVQFEQDRIINDIRDDIAKYAPGNDRIKARQCFDSIPAQLSKENKKFQYSIVEKKATKRKFETSIDWLENAGLIKKSYNISIPMFPLEGYKNEDQYRVYLADTGLLCAMFGYQIKESILSDSLVGPVKGGLYENLVADFLLKRGERLFYYKKENSLLEVEFLLERGGKVVPVEVKATKGASKSLNELLKNVEIEMGYKLTGQNSGVVGKKITLPWYMGIVI